MFEVMKNRGRGIGNLKFEISKKLSHISDAISQTVPAPIA
jgi:hypothetical protein